jgi:hypothetical protein
MVITPTIDLPEKQFCWGDYSRQAISGFGCFLNNRALK